MVGITTRGGTRLRAGHELGTEDLADGVRVRDDTSESSSADSEDAGVLAASQDAADCDDVVAYDQATPAERETAEGLAVTMARLKAMRSMAEDSTLPHLVQHIQQEELQLRRRQRQATVGVQRVIGRWLREQAAHTRLDVERVRQDAEVQRAAAAETKRLASIEEAKKKFQAEERRSWTRRAGQLRYG